jgi:hypothetical protein
MFHRKRDILMCVSIKQRASVFLKTKSLFTRENNMVNHSILIFVSFFSFIVAFPSCAQSSSFNLYGNWKLWYIIHFIYFCLSIFILLYSPSRLWRRARLISVLIITSLSVLITSLYSYLFHKQDVFSYIAVGIFISIQIYYLARIRYNLDVEDIRFNLGNLGVEDMEFLD